MIVTVENLDRSRELVQPALREAVARLDADMRLVVSYHLGWCTQDGTVVSRNGGKAIRPALVLLAAEAAGGTPQDAVAAAVAVELVHNFSLVHDDLMDRDTERRHRPTVWSLWGDATAVLAGDAMLCLAQETLLESTSPYAQRAAVILARATRELIRGQAQDVDFERRQDVTMRECLDMAAGKTGALLSASMEVGAVMAGAPQPVVEALSDYGSQVGMAFQLVDDLLGIWGEPQTTGKPVFSDLRSAKKTLPVTWTIEHGGAAGRELAGWLATDAVRTEAELRATATLIERAGGRAWAEDEATGRIGLAAEALDRVHLTSASRDRLTELARYIVDRQS